jgi:predicted transcriptional regulator
MIQRLEKQLAKEARDLQVLEAVIDHSPIGIVRLAQETDIPEYKVRYSLRMLENDDLIDPTPQGAVPVENIDERVAAINAGLDGLSERVAALAELDMRTEA